MSNVYRKRFRIFTSLVNHRKNLKIQNLIPRSKHVFSHFKNIPKSQMKFLGINHLILEYYKSAIKEKKNK